MKYCQYCGTQIADEAKFCSNCGKAVWQAPASEPPVNDEMKKNAADKINARFSKGKDADKKVQAEEEQKPQETKFEPKKGKMRKPGTGCISKINDHLYEGRYSPKDAYGKRMARNIYAPTREECEEKLAILIKEMKAEIAEQKAKLRMAQ